MTEDPTGSINSAMAAMRQIREQAMAEAAVERKSKLSAIQVAKYAEKQIKLLEEANRLAASSEARALAAEQQTRIAKRHAALANIIAVISLAIAVAQYLGR